MAYHGIFPKRCECAAVPCALPYDVDKEQNLARSLKKGGGDGGGLEPPPPHPPTPPMVLSCEVELCLGAPQYGAATKHWAVRIQKPQAE